MAAERKLGRGLDSLLGEARAQEGEEILNLALDQIHRSPHQPRHDFDEAALEELAASIRANGVLQPIIVRPGAIGYEIVAGERRARAAKMAGLGAVPAIVRRYSDEDTLVLSLVENIQRADLNAIDRASAYRRLVSHLNVTQDEVARRLGLDPSSVSNMIRLLDLPPEVQELVRGGGLSMGHARAILGLSDGIDRIRLAERVIREELSVRAVERLIRDGATAPKRRVVPRKAPQVMALESELRGILGTKVRIEDRRGKGRIVIDYYSPEEFERLVDALRGERGFSRTDL
ncbi:MAG: ParB/RepB/Spo0J family partition protein [Planctomycetes bacterium]|nr:ParB/RepB/Spo0J family partition protein [Planctomycetota bacterium]